MRSPCLVPDTLAAPYGVCAVEMCVQHIPGCVCVPGPRDTSTEGGFEHHGQWANIETSLWRIKDYIPFWHGLARVLFLDKWHIRSYWDSISSVVTVIIVFTVVINVPEQVQRERRPKFISSINRQYYKDRVSWCLVQPTQRRWDNLKFWCIGHKHSGLKTAFKNYVLT